MAIQRIVCFKFKQGTSPERIQQHMDDFAGMEPAIVQIKQYRGGLTKPGDNNQPPDYDTMHYMIFDSLEEIEIYRVHEAHQNFIRCNRDCWEKVLVLNSEVDGVVNFT